MYDHNYVVLYTECLFCVEITQWSLIWWFKNCIKLQATTYIVQLSMCAPINYEYQWKLIADFCLTDLDLYSRPQGSEKARTHEHDFDVKHKKQATWFGFGISVFIFFRNYLMGQCNCWCNKHRHEKGGTYKSGLFVFWNETWEKGGSCWTWKQQ